MLKRLSRLALWIGICAATADFQDALGQGYPYPWGPKSSRISVEESTGSAEFPSTVYDSTGADDVVYELRRFAVTDRLGAIRVARTWLRSNARATRLAGLAVLEWFGPDAVPAMAEIESLAGEEISIAELVRRTRIAGFVGDPGRSLLLSALEDRREAVVLAALRAVFRLPDPDPEILRRIASLSSSANERIRYWAALCCFAREGGPEKPSMRCGAQLKIPRSECASGRSKRSPRWIAGTVERRKWWGARSPQTTRGARSCEAWRQG